MISETLEIIHELEALKGSLRGEVEARAAVIGAGCVPRDRFGLVTSVNFLLSVIFLLFRKVL